MVVDDQHHNVEAMASYLKADGHVISVAQDSATALTCIHPIDVALIDFDLGTGDKGENGLTLIAQLRTMHPNIRCALVTAERGPDIAAKARAANVTLLAKPVAPDMLQRWLANEII